MKIQKVLLLAGIGASLIFSSCENFMHNSLLKNELDEIIKDASAERMEISVFALNSYGTLTGETGGTYKIGTENLNLGFTENKGWQFAEWQVTDAEGNKTDCSSTDNIYIKNPLSSKTTFSINGSAKGYKIEAVCMARPNVEIFSPSYIANGINADTPIEITFAHEVDEESFIFSEKEFVAYGSSAKAIRKDSQDASTVIVGIELAGEKLFKNITIAGANGENLSVHYNTPVLSADRKKVTLSVDSAKLFDFSSVPVKDVYVTVSPKISYEYKTQNEKTVKIVPENKFDFNYKVSAATISKAKITFSAKNDEDKTMGTLTYNGQLEFNIGQTIQVEFVPNTDFKFVGWDITGNEDNVVSVKTEGASIIVKVLKASDSVKIAPVCEEKPKAQILFTSTNGVMSPAGYVECMQGQVIPLNFSCDSSYKFIQWKIINTNTGETVDKSIADLYYQFEDENAQSTFLTIKNPKDVYSIVADCYVRPHVYSHYPDINSGSDVKRDQSVKIYFDHDMDKMSLYYDESEAGQIQKVTGFAGFLTDSAGRYGYKTSDGNQFFKNFSITNRATGENYAKYYKQPQLIDPKTLVVPVKVVLNRSKDKDGNEIIKIDETASLPAYTEVMFQLGDKIGYYAENGELVPLVFDSNLTWFYTNDGNIDETKPTIVSCSLNTNDTDSRPLSQVEPVDKQTLKAAYLSSGLVNYNVIVKDTSGNLSALTLKYSLIKTIGNTLESISEPVVYSKALNLVSSDKINGTCAATVNLFGLPGSNSEGVYELWFEVTDESGNTGESDKYYIVRDKTGPGKTVDPKTLKIFVDGTRIMFCDWNFSEKPFDYESTTLYITSDDTKVETAYSMDDANNHIVESSYVTIRIVSKDIFGNETLICNPGTAYGSKLEEKFEFYTNGWFRNPYQSHIVLAPYTYSLDYSNYEVCGVYDAIDRGALKVDKYIIYIKQTKPLKLLTKAEADAELAQLNSSMSAEFRSRYTWTYPQEGFRFYLSPNTTLVKVQDITGIDPYKNYDDYKDNNFWISNGTDVGFEYYRYKGYPEYKYLGPNYNYNVKNTDKGYLVAVIKL